MDKTSNARVVELTGHFFRHEYSKMVAVISRYFQTEDLNLAEDIVQDTLLEALRHWEFNGIPPNPTAWLYTVARNKTLNTLKKAKLDRRFKMESSASNQPDPEEISIEDLFSTQMVSDSLLQMMFVCCHPSLSSDSQVTLILKTLCGLSIAEIAKAFVTSTGTINKRLVRARRTLKENNVKFEIPEDLIPRISNVLKAIYLLFNEGYSATKGSQLIRYELCIEAIRLGKLIVDHPKGNNSEAQALLALMYLNSARFKARIDKDGGMVDMSDQDRSAWNGHLINQGLLHLDEIRDKGEISIYHILATISAHHCVASSYEETDWSAILSLYDQLLIFDHSPIVRLNRAVALAKVSGNQMAIQELTQLESEEVLKSYFPLYATLANLYMEEELFEKAAAHFERSLRLTDVAPEIKIITSRLAECKNR
ncbi:MAG: RNA polymerase sigma factor [Cyclobacteriaceae bacterium]